MKGTREVIIYNHCDEWKSYSSMDFPEEVFANTKSGRSRLWKTIAEDLKEDTIEIDGYDVNEVKKFVLDGEIQEAHDRITYASLMVVPVLG